MLMEDSIDNETNMINENWNDSKEHSIEFKYTYKTNIEFNTFEEEIVIGDKVIYMLNERYHKEIMIADLLEKILYNN